MKLPKVNPELFKQEAPKELAPRTYYAYLDSIDRAYGYTSLRFDCVLKNDADRFQISSESIIGLPSIVLEVKGTNHIIDDLFKISGWFTIYNFESNWMVIETSIRKANFTTFEYFNFTQVGDQQISDNYTINNIQFENELDSLSSAKIQQLKKATQLFESPKEDILAFINEIKLDSFSHVNVYNVGQGNCNALVNSENIPLLYFDVGGGAGANSFTFPANFRLCHSLDPSVILSHWDLDHIINAVYDTRLLNTKWLVPVQHSISNTAIQIATALLRRGNLICWNSTLGNELSFFNNFIAKCSARRTNKNSSGLALFVDYADNQYALLPGDATFKYIPNVNSRKLIGMVASHHGAKSSIHGMPPSCEGAMLAYSYGENNTHKHAHRDARRSYIRNNWGVGLDTKNGNIGLVRHPGLILTPCNGKDCTLQITQHF